MQLTASTRRRRFRIIRRRARCRGAGRGLLGRALLLCRRARRFMRRRSRRIGRPRAG